MLQEKIKGRLQQTGKAGEAFARSYLVRRGYAIQACNKRFGRGEIDIIALQAEVLVFIEVKVRQGDRFGYPEAFVLPSQQVQYHLAATEYLHKIGWDKAIRFDVIALQKQSKGYLVRHFEDAF